MLPFIFWTLGFLPFSGPNEKETEPRPTIFVEERTLVCLIRAIAGGWVDVIDCSSNPNIHAQQICNSDCDLDRRKIVWLYEDGQNESKPNLWRERLAGQGFQVRSLATLRNRHGELECLKNIPGICKLLVEVYPELTWYFQSRRSLVELRLNQNPFEPIERFRPNQNNYAN